MVDMTPEEIEKLRQAARALPVDRRSATLYFVRPNGQRRRVSWSPFHRWLWRQWNGFMLFCYSIRYGWRD